MTGKHRFGATLLIVSVMTVTCGSLGASPLGHRAMLGDEGTPALTAFVEWMSSLFSWSRSQGKVSKPTRPKVAVQVDPDGKH